MQTPAPSRRILTTGKREIFAAVIPDLFIYKKKKKQVAPVKKGKVIPEPFL